MRDPFPYETNVSLIREFLVPYPLSSSDWKTALSQWRASKKKVTLLEFLAEQWFSEDELLGLLKNSTGSEVLRDPEYLSNDELDATGNMLLSHGFRILRENRGKRYLAGGLSINPDLSKLLGQEHCDWQWVLVTPIRNERFPDKVDEVPTFKPHGYGLNNWLRELINGLRSNGAIDIHFERADDTLTIRAHKPNGMQTIGKWSDGRAVTVIRLLCTWGGISSRDHKSFSDGRLILSTGGTSHELRLSIIPTVNGESLVLRAPTPSLSICGLNSLGVPEELINEILDTAMHDPGMLICSGPTGSGKTTTLYGILHELRNANLKILTIEDPVEQIIPFAVQSSVDQANDWTFDRAIHAFLRQDPDLIMVGEIRDKASAVAACRAALTGHCVLTTMHASNENAAVERLQSWGIPNGILSESLRIIIHQHFRELAGNPHPRPVFQYKLFRTGDQAVAI